MQLALYFYRYLVPTNILRHGWIIILFVIGGSLVQAQPPATVKGKGYTPSTCFTSHNWEKLLQKIKLSSTELRQQADTTYYTDPLETDIDSPHITSTNYVDLDPASNALLDYRCNKITYDGHKGSDFVIPSFYHMDEGHAILATAPGTVILTHDGEYDRHYQQDTAAVANKVIIDHPDSTIGVYLHLRKHSIQVKEGATVNVGDTLGYIGSSGYSDAPHLHFALFKFGQQDTTVIDPYQGACQPNPTRWQSQPDYQYDRPFRLLLHGVTNLSISYATILEYPPSKSHFTAGTSLKSWVRPQNIESSDTLTWKVYENGNLWNENSFSPSGTYTLSYWYSSWTLPTASNYYGNWRIDIFHNGNLIAQQYFSVDGQSNQLPQIRDTVYTVEPGKTIKGRLPSYDPDGKIFWHQKTDSTDHGKITLYKGRQRKFRYQPNANYTGSDTLTLQAIDDENESGDEGNIIFDVTTNRPQPPNDHRPLLQIYPNPTQQQLTISYHLSQAQQIKLTLYNVHGRFITTLANSYQSAGHHRYQWVREEQQAGVYFVELQYNNQTFRRQFLLFPAY